MTLGSQAKVRRAIKREQCRVKQETMDWRLERAPPGMAKFVQVIP